MVTGTGRRVVLILGIESATNQVGCALGGPDGVLASVHSMRPRHHAESITPQIRFLVDQAGVTLKDVDAVAVDVGPGLFTGLRVGITTAISLAFALRVPMLTSDSLGLLAYAVTPGPTDIESLVDARRGEVFHARYQRGSAGVLRLSEPVVANPTELAADLRERGRDVLLVGDGARAHLDVFGDIPGVGIAPPGLDLPSAASLVAMVRPGAEAGEFVDPADVTPLYLRDPDAKAKWDPTPIPTPTGEVAS